MIPPGATVIHEPHGFIHLEASNADDLGVVNSARVSYGKRSTWHEHGKDVGRLKEEDAKLVGYLLKNGHGTPFEHNYFTFHVRAPLFVFREWHRHRIGWSYNEESARYVELAPDFYLPDDEHCRKQVGKPGHYTYEQVAPEQAEHTRMMLDMIYRRAYSTYKQMMSEGIAKEIARACLPVATYSQMYATCNARSLMNFLELRNAPNAMREIRDYAHVMELMLAEKMPVTYNNFVANGRKAP
jgi:thymidylate synthase (FAD)